MIALLALLQPGLADEPSPKFHYQDGVFEVRLTEPVGTSMDRDRYDDLLEWGTAHSPDDARSTRIVRPLPDGSGYRDVQFDLPPLPPVPDKETVQTRSLPFDNPGEADGILSGKAVYLSQCHGWLRTSWGWGLQRTLGYETVEDYHNPEAMSQFLTAYLENAGARVYTVKERDLQTATAIADNDGSGYAESGSGFVDGLAGFADAPFYDYAVDPFDAGTTRTFPADGGGIATWTPAVPEDGYYAVYVSWDALPDNASDAHYRLTHPGGTIDRNFDQTVHGSTWQYVDHLWLTQGNSLTVELIGDSAEAGATLSADAVRIGGGMGIVRRGGQTTGRPRWESSGVLGSQFLGAPVSVYHPNTNTNVTNGGSDPSSRSRWADWEHPAGEDAVYVAWHSNAAGNHGEGGTARGTSVHYAGGGGDSPDPAICTSGIPAITGSYTLADLIQTELVDAATTRHDPSWNDRGVRTDCFSEVNPSNNDEMPAVLVEHGFHNTGADADLIKQPVFRRDSSRAIAHGIIRYFAGEDGVTAAFTPEPPLAVRAEHDAAGTRLSWQPGPSGGTNGDPATGYLVYASSDGRAWDNGFAVTGTTTVVNTPFEARFFRVVATNDAGQSFPSEVFGSFRSPDGFAQVLVVGAFDRLDSGLLPTEAVPGFGTVRRMFLQELNDKLIIAHHGRALGLAGWYFDSASDEALPNVTLDDYDLIIWATGEESTVDESISDDQQAALQAFVDGGGSLIVSGAEVLWDLDERGTPSDLAFATDVLGATMAADASQSNVVNGTGILSGVTLDFTDGRYPVEFPDVLASSRTPIANYSSGELAAVFGDGVAMFGFPLDAVTDDAALADLFEQLLPEMVEDLPPTPPPDTDPPPTPTDTDTPPPTPTDTDPPTAPPTDTDGTGDGPTYRRIALTELGQGCGCRTGGPSGLWLLLLPVLLRRRLAPGPRIR